MTLDELQARLDEINASIAQTTNQVLVLHGHKGEIEHQIQTLLAKIAAEEAQKLAKPAKKK